MVLVAVAIIWHGETIAVGRREGGDLAGFDEFPGGKCNSGESPDDAVVRESLEETGLAIRVLGLRERVRHDYPHRSVEIHFFDAVPVGRETSLLAPFTWWPIDRVLTGNFPPANRRVLESIAAHRGPMQKRG